MPKTYQNFKLDISKQNSCPLQSHSKVREDSFCCSLSRNWPDKKYTLFCVKYKSRCFSQEPCALSSSCVMEKDINLSADSLNSLLETQVTLYLPSSSKGHVHQKMHKHTHK